MKQTLILLLIIGSFSCNKLDSQIEAVFEKDELKTQDIIINYLDSVIINYTGRNNLNKAYPLYLFLFKSRRGFWRCNLFWN